MNTYSPIFSISLSEAANNLSTDQFVDHISRTALDHSNRNSATANRLLALGLMEKFSCITSARTLECVAANPNTPAKTLHQLSKHENVEVKIAVSENASTPIATLMELARCADCDLRLAMAENANLPAFVLQILSIDDNPYVSCRAAQTIELVDAAKRTPRLAKVVSMTRSTNANPRNGFRRFIQTLTNIAGVC